MKYVLLIMAMFLAQTPSMAEHHFVRQVPDSFGAQTDHAQKGQYNLEDAN